MLNHPEITALRQNLSASEDPQQRLATRITAVAVCLDGALNAEIVAEENTKTPVFRPPERIIGTPFDSRCLNGVLEAREPIDTRKYIELTQNSRIVAWRAFLDDMNHLHVGDSMETPAKMDAYLARARPEYEGFFCQSTEQEWKVYFASRAEPNHFPGTTLFIPFIEQGNYGSFLFRCLPGLLFAAESRVEAERILVPERTPWLMSTLELLNMAHLPVFTIREVCGDSFERLYTTVAEDYEGMLDEKTLLRLDGMKSRVDLSYSPGAKIYVSRRLSDLARPNYRVLLNERAVEDRVSSQGFAKIYPETMPFRMQISAFCNADIILGPSGSGMLNAIFANAGAMVIDMESFHGTVRQHAKLYSSSSKAYSFLFGALQDGERPPAMRAWTVDINELDRALTL